MIVLKVDRALFGLMLVVVNGAIEYFTAILEIAFPNNAFIPPTIIFIGIVGNAAMVYLTTEKQAAPPP